LPKIFIFVIVAADEDKILYDRIRNGDRNSFDSLFQKYYCRLNRFAFSFTKSKELAEEAVQNMFVKLWCQRASLEISTSVAAYLFTAVKNHALNEIKKIGVRTNYESEYLQRNEGDENVPVNEVIFKKAVQSAVTGLPDKCREIFRLSRNDGLTYEEIAEYLKISKKTVENQMGIAFKKLREILKPALSQIIE
jgi:RNA polymerase sigma-70 factor, ECF subfamily